MPPNVLGERMKCPKCQFDNPDGAKFCSECGNKLELACPECGKANPLGSKFCNECGHNLKEAKEAPCIDYNQPQSYATKFLADKILTKFVGRIKETKRLKGLCELAKSGSGQVVELEGEAGVGKSRLLYEFKNALPQGEYTYLEGRCYHYGGTTPYLPILDIMRTYFGLKEGEGEHLIKRKIKEKASRLGWKLKDFLPPLQEILSLKVEDEAYLKMEPSQKRERIFEAIRELFVQEAQEKPVLLAFEDLHWIDKSSEDFLNYLFGSIENTRILLILLYRPQYRPQLEPKPYHSKIILEELPADSSVELVQSILEHGDVEREIAELILSRAQGNPLFIEEVTQSLLESGFIQKGGNQYVLAEDGSNIHLPDTMQEIIGARIDRAGESIKRIMQIGSVIGSEFAFRILQSMMRMKEELRSYLVSFEELAFLHERSSFPEMEYVFKHALIQEVTYNSLFHRKRKEIHGNIGRAIEALYADSIEEYYELLAYHYSNSDDFEKAFQYLKLSGDKATRNYSLWEAFHFYKEAINILKQQPTTEQKKREQIHVLRLITIPMRLLGYPDGSLQFLQQGGKLAKDIKDVKSQIIFYSKMGNYYSIKGGDPLLGIEYSEKSFQNAVKIEDIEITAGTGFYLSAAYVTAGRYDKVVDLAPKVIAELERLGLEHESFSEGMNIYSALYGLYGSSLAWLGNFKEGEVFLEKGLRFASHINDKRSLGLTEFLYGCYFFAMGNSENAIDHFRKGIRFIEEVKYISILGLAWSGLGWGHYLQGDLEAARMNIEKGLKIHSDAGTMWLSSHFLLLAMVYLDSGDLKSTQKSMQEAVALSQNNKEKQYEAISRMWLGRILGKAEASTGDGEEYILQGIKICNELKIKPFSAQGYFFLGELYADKGQKEKALENLKKAEGMFKEMRMDYWLTKTEEVMGSL